MKNVVFFFIIFVFFIVSCQSSVLNPSQVVQNYLNALVNKNAANLISLSCKNWESEAQKQLDSFMNVGTSLENVDCSVDSQTTDSAKVACTGFIKLTYDAEIQKIDLSKRVYQLSFENNEWRVCISK
jgi:hypothetical protein